MYSVSSAIISGGKALRLNGINKSQLQVGNQLLIERQITVLRKIFDDIVLVANGLCSLNNVTLVSDYFINAGPLAGIHAALKNSRYPYTFVVSGDMPFLNQRLIVSMLQIDHLFDYDLIEPLHAIYSRNCLPVIEHNLQSKKFAIRSIYHDLRVLYWDLPSEYIAEEVFFNINYPEDIVKANIYANKLE